MSFLTPLAFLGGLLAAPIILLYMLRLRRREVMVSSTFLWQQVLQDNEANAPWQRLRRNLLLFLQLLILALLVFALARPFIEVPAVSAGQIALLLDASASMNATDIDDGEASRFEAAQERALEIVNTMGPDDSMTVIRVADVPEVLAPSTRDSALLRDTIVAAEPTSARADWTAALTLAAAGAAGAENFSVVIVSDGGLGNVGGLPGVAGDIRYVPVGESNGNVAISALATDTLPGEETQLFSQIVNYGATDAEIIYDLRVDGELFTAERYTIPAGGTLPLVSEALPEGFGAIQAGITPAQGSDTQDFLLDDNDAWTVGGGGGGLEALLMSPGNVFIDQVLRSLPTVDHLTGDITRGLPTRQFDLTILDSWLPDELPPGDLLFINPPTPGVPGMFTSVPSAIEDTANPAIVGDSDLTAFLEFDTVNVRSFDPVIADWADPLITVEGGVLLWAGEFEDRQVAILTFAVQDSDLPLQIAWPILMNNLMTWYQPDETILTETALRVGDSLLLRPPVGADTLRITRPDGDVRRLDVDRETLVYADTGISGIYTLEAVESGNVMQSTEFAVNLFDTVESNIAVRDSITLGADVISEAGEGEEVGQREFWPWLAAIALLILMAEWWVYHRRLRGPQAPIFGNLLRRREAS